MMVSATKIFRFEAAHSLPNHEGKCRNLHGHNYKLEVTVAGPIQTEGPEKGMVIDFSKLKKQLNEYLVMWDHAYLNDMIKNPTAENMVVLIAEHCQGRKINITRLKLWETDDSFVEWQKTEPLYLTDVSSPGDPGYGRIW